MRRGHASIGGWRNENSRYFKPRSGGPPQFRGTRNYHLPDAMRFQPPVLPHFRPNPFGNRPLLTTPPSEHHDRNKYRTDHRQSNQYRSHHSKPLFSKHGHMRHDIQENPGAHQMYNDNKDYYDSSCSNMSHINSMGDVDHRTSSDFTRHQEIFNRRSTTRWNSSPDEKKSYIEDRHNYKPHKYHDNTESNRIPSIEYSGHRPPSSDHYGGNPNPTLENSNSFSRSIDDTVDIIRKRLQNRKEPQQHLEEQRDHNDELNNQIQNPTSSSSQDVQPIQPVKKKPQRQNMNVEANCGKMKNKIVHELFKMDKDKIHKLMDNPNSSSKFEYALSTLITESQNSLNKHLRSVAEKSLCSSEAFIHNDNNTIYEDTFMKQMQGILDPQDTVFLEDIKPLVLAELSKVLQLDEYDQTFQFPEDEAHCSASSNQENYNNYNYENYSQSEYYEQIQSPRTMFERNYDNAVNNKNDYITEPETSNPLFERRSSKHTGEHKAEKSYGSELRRNSRSSVDTSVLKDDSINHEKHHHRRSLDNKLSDSDHSQPLFDPKAEELSEDDDPFAELDKQYHVAVDPSFIDTYGISSPQQSTTLPRTPIGKNDLCNRSPQNENNVIKDIDAPLLNFPKSPLELVSTTSSKLEADSTVNNSNDISTIPIKQETIKLIDSSDNIINTNHESSIESRNEDDQQYKFELNPKTSPLINSRKRSIDQKPSHRKEKRKKSNSISTDPPNQSVFDNSLKDQTHDAVISSSKTNVSKEPLKDIKKKDTVDKNYSDKYVKRKENQKKCEKAEGAKKRQRSLSSSQSTISPKENSNNNNKIESKSKLQTIDMFLEHPKKINVHQAHRNTALPPSTPLKNIEIVKPQVLTPFNRKVTKKHASTQVVKKCITKETQTFECKSVSTRFCQTEKIKTWSKSVQTDPVVFEKSPSKATDAFERMKEIDMEIQALLQEKFKLYNSLESNSQYPSTIQSLGMTVLNVPSELKDSGDGDIDSLTEDAIVDDFTSIPVEELEQIALESVEEQRNEKKENKKTRRQRVLAEERANSSSPTTRGSAKKAKTPNISLIEQILTDDRPLEDIISLDDLESTPVKNKKLQAIPKKKVAKKIRAPKKSSANLANYTLRNCSVVLNRDDITKYLKPIPEESVEVPDIQEVFEEPITQEPTVHMQFDMLDVSEDIVIGDVCEIKSTDEKDLIRTEEIISEEIILDNSQSDVQIELNQGENICKVYDYSSDDNLRRDSITVSGHADAVLAIESIENNFVAACLDGNVYYFTSEGQLLSTLRGSNLAVTCITIVKEKYGTTVYTGSLDSRIRYYDLETGLEKGPECNVLSPIQTMDRAWDTIFVGTRTGFVLQFECKNNMLIPVSTVKFSEQSILALRAMKEGPRKVLLVAARSEDVTIKDAQTGLLLRTLQGPKMTVYTLLYEDGKIYCGTSSNQIHVFDYASGSHAGVHEGGKGAVCLRATGGLVFAGCYDGCVYVYREGEPRPRAQLRGPSLMLLSLAVVGTKIIAGYKDRSLYIWKIPLSILQEMIL